MADSSSPHEFPEQNNDEALELNKDLESMIENVENMSVQLTWMAYDMVALRTSPALAASMRRLEEVYQICRAAVCGNREQELEEGKCP